MDDVRDTRPDREKIRQGRITAKLREDGKELVDEERLTTMFQDLGLVDEDGVRTDGIEESAEELAKRAMEILRG